MDIILSILGAQKLSAQIEALPNSASDKKSFFISYDKWLRFSISSKNRFNWEIRADWENNVMSSPLPGLINTLSNVITVIFFKVWEHIKF